MHASNKKEIRNDIQLYLKNQTFMFYLVTLGKGK